MQVVHSKQRQQRQSCRPSVRLAVLLRGPGLSRREGGRWGGEGGGSAGWGRETVTYTEKRGRQPGRGRELLWKGVRCSKVKKGRQGD